MKKRAAAPRKPTTGLFPTLIVIGLVIVLGWYVTKIPDKKDEKRIPSTDTFKKDISATMDKYEDLKTRTLRQQIDPRIAGVHIFKKSSNDHLLVATGGMYTGSNGTHGEIFTVAHTFGKKKDEPTTSDLYYYQILQPWDTNLYPIKSVRRISVIADQKKYSKDVVICTPGEASPITNSFFETDLFTGTKNLTFRTIDEKFDVTSIITGEKLDIVGAVQTLDGRIYYALDYASWQSQSGTPFTGPSNHVFFLSGVTTIDKKIIENFKLPDDRKRISFCTGIILN